MATPEAETTGKMQPPSYETSQQQAGQHVTTTTVITQPHVVVPTTVMTPLMYGSTPINVVCPHCRAQIITATSYESGILTWLFCGGIAVVGCWLGCCLVPFCMDDLKDCRHTCPNCNNFLGIYRRL